ncbi:MAG TPA: PIN domain-containing protein [Tepidisphaeraceae bacterium]|nr:PIN domain-containing protein [Tepidisphaeraceae bacterium]
MAENVVLDTSAILTLTGNEPGADEVQRYLTDAIAGRVTLYGSFVSLTEVEYITLQEEGEAVARQRLIDLNALPIHWVHSDQALCGEAAKLKAANKMSFADSFVAATAIRFDATLIHKDPEFHGLASIVKQKMLPPK